MQQRQFRKNVYPPNHRLREERERRGLALKDVAELIDLPDPRTLGRWERGVFFPQPHYRQRLCQLYGKSAEELGLVRVQVTEDQQVPEPFLSSSQAASEYLWKVPSPLNSFMGREQDSAALCALLLAAHVHLVNLTGPGGVGKTCLSIEVAHKVREHFHNGICFVSLAALSDPMLVLPTIAQTVGIPESGTCPVLEQMKRLLRERSFLLVLDNFEQVVPAAPLLDELLAACRGLKILVTSREVLHLQVEQEFALAPFAVPDLEHLPEGKSLMQYASVALFVQRTQAHLPAFRLTPENAHAVAEIRARLDGLPLAIELAATRIKLLPPRALLTQLAQGVRLLKSDLRTLPERQRTLSNAITWSYHLLDEQEQWLFRHLAIFPGSCTFEAAEGVLNARPAFDLLDILASLIDKSLLQRQARDDQTPCFVMLEVLREYGLERLEEHGELETCQRAHAMYYLAFVEQAKLSLNGILQGQWLALLEQEKANLRAALAWLLRAQETELALRFCDAFGKFCGLRGYWAEEQHWLQETLALPPTIKAKEIRARVLRRAGHLAYRLRDLVQARLLQEESVALSREVGDLYNLAGALSGLGWVFYRQKKIAQANQLLHESLTAARETGDRWAIANSLESLGRLLHFQGRSREARRLLDESVVLARAVEDKETLARILTTLVSIMLAQDELEEAEILARESFRLAQELATGPLVALALNSLGDVALALGEDAQAVQSFERRMGMARELGDLPAIAVQQLRLGELALFQGDLARATALVQESLTFFRQQGDNPNLAAALSVFGDIQRTSGKLVEANALYKEACLLDREVRYQQGLGRHLFGLALVALAQDRLEQAACLFGAIDTQLKFRRDQRSDYEQAMKHLRAQPGGQSLLTAWVRGHEMSLEEAIAYALDVASRDEYDLS